MPGPSPSREERSPLNVVVHFGIYALLAGLVAASFMVTPERSTGGPVALAAPRAHAAAPTEPEARRVTALARGSRPAPRDAEYVVLSHSSYSPAPIEETAADLAVVPQRLPEPTPEPAADPTPEPTPESTPAPPPIPQVALPRPIARPPSPVVSETTAWAEARMLELINASRTRAGLVALAVDEHVAAVARAHSGVEAQVRYVYHDGLDGTASSRNAPACGTGWWGENTGKIWRDNVDALHLEFMNEPWLPLNHRTVIMDPTFRRVGIGAVFGPDAMYMTMVFCR